jgi:hypothetical protein
MRRQKGETRESSWAKQAFTMYLQLPKPRRLADLAGKTAPTKGGGQSKPFSMYTLEEWSSLFNWSARADAWDEETALAEREAIRKWRLKEAERREKDRLEAADLQREMAVTYLRYPDQEEIAPEKRGTPRPMQECDPMLLNMADKYLKTAADIEQRDLAAIAKSESQRADDKPQPVVVLTADALNDLRPLVRQIQEAQRAIPETTPDPQVIDAEFTQQEA